MDLEGHSVLQVWRKHWWPACRAAAQAWLLVQALYRPAATILLLIIAAWSWVLELPDWTPPQLGLALVLLLLAMGSKVAWEVVDWRNDTYVLTESHVVDVQQQAPFRQPQAAGDRTGQDPDRERRAAISRASAPELRYVGHGGSGQPAGVLAWTAELQRGEGGHSASRVGQKILGPTANPARGVFHTASRATVRATAR